MVDCHKKVSKRYKIQKILSNYILKLVAMASFQGLTHKGETPFKESLADEAQNLFTH